jgi:hypothetical protein
MRRARGQTDKATTPPHAAGIPFRLAINVIQNDVRKNTESPLKPINPS